MPGKPLEQMRKEYFALTTDKDRANYLWRNRIGGGVITEEPSNGCLAHGGRMGESSRGHQAKGIYCSKRLRMRREK